MDHVNIDMDNLRDSHTQHFSHDLRNTESQPVPGSWSNDRSFGRLHDGRPFTGDLAELTPIAQKN